MIQKRNKLPEFKNHKQIIELNDKASGLQGFIAIHSTRPGPALGGTRIFPYKTKQAALKDALKLSYAMTYKCAVAGLPFGGGKGVIIGSPKVKNINKILRAYSEAVDKLKGEFFTGEDVGMSEADVQYMLKFSPYFIGKSHLAGDPSYYASLSAFLCLKATLNYQFGSEKIKGRTFAIKGAGKTGSELAAMIYKEGGKIIICDTDSKKTKALSVKLRGIKIVDPKLIQKQVCDAYLPCAMGDDINTATAKTIQVKIICGTANNQLVDKKAEQILHKRNIIFVPDYLANAGGLINVSAELLPGGYSKNLVLKEIGLLKKKWEKILLTSKITGKTTSEIAEMEVQKYLVNKVKPPRAVVKIPSI